MQQAHEITRVALNPRRQVLESARVLLRCGILLAVMAGPAGCTGKGQTSGNGGPAPFQGDKLTAMRTRRPGLPSEPPTPHPPRAKAPFCFPVFRDHYDGPTPADTKR